MSASPLSGLLVVDLSRHLPGPLTARILCDLGARVIKVEEPEMGDPVRQAPPARGGTGALAAQLLAGLQSIALDLKQEPARRVLERLLERGNLMAWAAETGRPHGVGEPHALSGALPCYNIYRCRDGGLVALAALEKKFWRRFCIALGRKDLVSLQYDDSGATWRKVAVLMGMRPRSEWSEFFAEHDIPAEPVLAAGEARAHPQAEARGLLRAGKDGLPRLAYPALFDGERPTAPESVPTLGQHTERLLEELGMAPQGGSQRKQRAGGIGPRRSFRRWLWRWASSSRG